MILKTDLLMLLRFELTTKWHVSDRVPISRQFMLMPYQINTDKYSRRTDYSSVQLLKPPVRK